MSVARVTLVCGNCQRPFSIAQHEHARGKGKFCSFACASKGRRAQAPRTAAPLVPLVCQACGKDFTRREWEMKQPGRGKACSSPCANKLKSKAGMGQPAKRPKPAATQRPSPVSPRADDLPLTDGGAMVRCHGCQELRARGSFCVRCEWRAYEGVAS